MGTNGVTPQPENDSVIIKKVIHQKIVVGISELTVRVGTRLQQLALRCGNIGAAAFSCWNSSVKISILVCSTSQINVHYPNSEGKQLSNLLWLKEMEI